MDKDIIHGRMVDHIKEDILMIRNMVMVFTLGLTEENMKENGSMENNMEEANIFY